MTLKPELSHSTAFVLYPAKAAGAGNQLTPALHTHRQGIHPAAGTADHASPLQMQLSYAAIALRRGQLGILIRGIKLKHH